MKKSRKRINFDVPTSLVNAIQEIADMEGVTTAYWLRRNLEKIVEEKRNYVQ